MRAAEPGLSARDSISRAFDSSFANLQPPICNPPLRRRGLDMPKLHTPRNLAFWATTVAVAFACSPADPVRSASYDDLLVLFEEWREFERPDFIDGAPDYSAAAMAAQAGDLPSYRARLDPPANTLPADTRRSRRIP